MDSSSGSRSFSLLAITFHIVSIAFGLLYFSVFWSVIQVNDGINFSVSPVFAMLTHTPMTLPVFIEVLIASLEWSPMKHPSSGLLVVTSLFGRFILILE